MQTPVKRERKTKRNLAIKKMRAKGKTYQEIADYFGITRQRVYQLLKNQTMNKVIL
ncbi:MAG: helix-turn-helix domain-containing protein [Patescibacteria group bacterium]